MFQSNGFLFTTETTPAVTTDLAESAGRIDSLVGIADAVNVTDSPNCKSSLSSLLVSSEIRKKGLDVILQLTGRDINRIALESELLGALSIDVNKVLCLSGDQPPEDGPRPVNELNSAGLIELCHQIGQGFLADRVEIKNPLPLFPGAADDLYEQLSKPDSIEKLLLKKKQGAMFVQTQFCFDFEVIQKYSEILDAHRSLDDCKILIGMGPLKSAKQADWMRKNLWGINIADEILSRLELSDKPEETGENICRELIEKVMDLPRVDGVHLMGPSCEERSARIISSFR
ncbi:MAG: hypothetical protein CMQ40_08935 [Gammaproteobacteria bacterium]|nr:hypothetical protein [Gammaproteobacteria bacterium]